MNIYQGQNGSITERKTTDKNMANQSLKNIINNKILYKRKSLSIKKTDNYKSRTINVNHDYSIQRKFSLGNKNQSKVNSSKKINEQNLTNNFKEIIYHKSNYGNNILLPETSKHNIYKKEKYLSKMFWNAMNERNNNNIIENNKNSNNNIRVLSKKNQVSKNDINKIKTNPKFNKNNIIKKESSNNLENELNYEFEIKLMKKKIKQLEKTNNKLKLKLFNLKTEQNRLKHKNQKEKIISEIIEIYNLNQEINNNFQSDETNTIKSESHSSINSFKSMLLNIMDWKYNYENKLMIAQFISAIKTIININHDKNADIINEIKILLKKRNSYKKDINEIISFFEMNKSYKEYLLNLCNIFKFKNLEQLDDFFKASFIKYNEEYKEMMKLKNNVLYNYNKNRRKNTSCEKSQKFKNESKKRLIKNNSVLNININSRNIENIYGFSQRNEDYFTYRENKPYTINQNKYFKDLLDISGINKQNDFMYKYNYRNISNKENINSRNLNHFKVDIPDYIKSIAMHCIRNKK